MPEKRLEMVHLQLTRMCNLNCHFCGQWGDKGFFANCGPGEMTLTEWKQVVDSIWHYGTEAGKLPLITLWGGEPLLYPEFDDIVHYLRARAFELAVITNGVLLDRYDELIRSEFSAVYVSIDGPKAIHDSIRGKGVFRQAVGNIEKLKNANPKIFLMTTICPQNIEVLPELPYLFDSLGVDKVLLHELICLNSRELADYKSWLRSSFGLDATKIDSWHAELPPDYQNRKNEKLAEMFRRLGVSPAKTPVEYLPHGIAEQENYCLSPFRHLHVAWDGGVLFCTDFYDFSAGNVRNKDLIDIWRGEDAENFRREIMLRRCPACSHCSWQRNREYSFEN
ncbi:MAG: hypothetical protein A2017_18900 [Lentisphaerae bacterium GWF2_44_16]|nr:MAG: hypothetical protein A2017_18900 [Lentisphaerae bacterium GWF2_44_16]